VGWLQQLCVYGCWLAAAPVASCAIAQDVASRSGVVSPLYTEGHRLRAIFANGAGTGNSQPAASKTWQLASHAGVSSELASPEALLWLEELIRRNLPETYEDDRKWNLQKEVWDGIRLRREGWRLETERKHKLVNAGTWTRYRISIVDPDENLFIQFQQLEMMADGRVAFTILVDCSLDVFGRLSQWARDVQLISISANADAACRLTLAGTVKFEVNPLTLPPQVSLRPQIDRAHIDLTYYRVRRISQIGGDFAKILGQGLRRVVDEKIEELNGKLAGKINEQLARHADKLSFSAQDWLRSKFTAQVSPADRR
jgi:hypothetical protein